MNTQEDRYTLFKRRATGQYIITEVLPNGEKVEVFSSYSEALANRAHLRFRANENQSTIF